MRGGVGGAVPHAAHVCGERKSAAAAAAAAVAAEAGRRY